MQKPKKSYMLGKDRKSYCSELQLVQRCTDPVQETEKWFGQVSRSSGFAKMILRGQGKERRRGGKTIWKSGQEWTLPAQLIGKLKTGHGGKDCC